MKLEIMFQCARNQGVQIALTFSFNKSTIFFLLINKESRFDKDRGLV